MTIELISSMARVSGVGFKMSPKDIFFHLMVVSSVSKISTFLIQVRTVPKFFDISTSIRDVVFTMTEYLGIISLTGV